MMNYSIKPISTDDRKTIMDIFNYYVENSFAAYPEVKLPYQAFDLLLQMSKDYPTGSIKNEHGKIVGFGMLRAHNPMPTFSQTAEVTYFIHPDHTGKGLGRMLLAFFEKEGRKKGIKYILANISSFNPRSIEFHEKMDSKNAVVLKTLGRKMVRNSIRYGCKK